VHTIVRHRRSGRSGKLTRPGQIAAILAAALVLATLTIVYLKQQTSSCDRPKTTVHVAASLDQAPVMTELAGQFNKERLCETVEVKAIAPAAVAAGLGPNWDEARDGPRPDVWAPDSSYWMLVVAARPEAAAILPTSAPSLASSPVVFALQKQMADVLGLPGRDFSFNDLLTAFGGGQTWARFGHAEWGPLRLGMVDPARSATGLAGVLSVLDPDNDNTMSSQELIGGVAFSQFVTAFAPDTSALFDSLKQATPDQIAGFPALEREVKAYEGTNPDVPLVAIKPSKGMTYADYPFVVLRAPWVSGARSALATDFLRFVQGDKGRNAYAAAGFGAPAQPGPSDRHPSAEAVSQLLGMWTVLQRENNVLVALDTSGSMNAKVPGTGLTRLQMMQRAATQGIALLNNQSIIGLWEFATDLTPTTDYRELVPVGLAGENIGPVTRRQVMIGAIQQLTAKGDTGLYDTVLASYLAMQKAWRSNAQNVLVVITDGKNEDANGISLDELLTKLKAANRPDHPLYVIGIAVGPEADAAALDQIAKVTGGRIFVARDDVSAIQQIVLAFAGRLS
jgi:Ca-activated chloride channel family protein